MSKLTLSADAKASMKQNLNLELQSRKEKLVAMCEAQVASLRSRLERRVNRVPNNKRTAKIIDLIKPALPAKKNPAPAPISRRAQQTVPAPKPNPPAQPTRSAPARGVKRSSNEMVSDKENMAEQLSIPKKRTKTTTTTARTTSAAAPRTARTTAAPTTTRTTRAASRKVAAPEVLSPKSNNSRTLAQGRTRRAR
ncbi:hypothetical protein K469DRAFT_686231 [Zopfia rhizophila CBS 207.26]|uniref:Borealin N-terminal domain-containing protein n=1 Tax=Zopfia rhizophila CBS 207.26 TaxID=1314779 RepID=A0A6A6E904_9PEZI|nr:hypothetical protein K469DRAFT_686231 [Zopfia rhizophila CBS 207.26]